MRYTIDESFTIRIFNDGEDIPFQLQPDYPNGDSFDSYEEAESWAKLSIAAFDADQPYAPVGKGLKGEAKSTLDAKASAVAKLVSFGLTAEEIAAVTGAPTI